jgi:hypothetical protein
MPFKVGAPRPPNAGRKKGTPNSATVELNALLYGMGCDPKQRLALVAMGELPCTVCRGSGRTKYKHIAKDGAEQILDRICESCYGTLKEKISPDLIFRASAELLQYQLPKRKAVELTGADGAPLDNRMTVVFVEAKDGKRDS